MKTLTLDNITIPLTPENKELMRKALEEESEEVAYNESYWYTYIDGQSPYECVWVGDVIDNYRKDQDNCLYSKHYTKDQAKEYFEKRDARRSAETKLRKIISEMNKKDGFVAKFDGRQANCFSVYDFEVDALDWYRNTITACAPLWRYSSEETAQFINENHADLLKAYLNG